jgi:hypothetical protein
MKRRMTFTAAAAVLALAALQGRAAADGTPAVPTAPATWQPHGTAISGAATTADAPAMRPATTYADSIGVGQTRFYGVTLDASSSAYVSAFALPPTGTRVTYGDGIELKLQSADGSDCDSRDIHFGDENDPRPIGSAVTRLIGVGTDCQTANQYTLQVHRTSAGTSDPGRWPLELRFVSEPGLKAGTAPPHAPVVPSGTASPTPLTTGTPRPAQGGTGFDTAAALKTGIWKDRVLPGETRFYKVPVDWGQRATVFADFSSAQVKDTSEYVSGGVRLTAYSPVREFVDDSDHSYAGTPTSLYEQLAPVSYANRASDDDEVARVRYAGWYYFVITVHPDVAKAVNGPVPITLRVDVTGDAQAAPAYAADARPAGIGVDAHDVSAANGTAASSSGSSGTSALRFLAFAALGAGTVLLLSLAVWYGTARRRAARAVRADRVADAVPGQAGQPGPGPSGW